MSKILRYANNLFYTAHLDDHLFYYSIDHKGFNCYVNTQKFQCLSGMVCFLFSFFVLTRRVLHTLWLCFICLGTLFSL